MADKKRKPRLNTNSGSIMPYRYVLIKIKSVKKIGNADKFGFCTYDVAYTFAKSDYYHDKYGDEVFHTKVSSSAKPYMVGFTYEIPMTIDID